jgi:hypothetical protein
MAGCNPKPETVIAAHPPNDGREWDCQCARCGSSCYSEACEQCDGDGVYGHDCGEDCCCCFDPEDNEVCSLCDGDSHWMCCISSSEWCQAHPRPGREAVQRGAIEWFTFESAGVAPSAAPSQEP